MRMLKMMLCVGVSIMVAGCALREGPTQDYTSTTGSMGDAGTVELADLAGRTFSVSDPESSATRKP